VPVKSPDPQYIELFTANNACRVIIQSLATIRLTKEEITELERRLQQKCQTKLSVKITLMAFHQEIADTEMMIFHCSGIMAITLPEALHLEPVIDSVVGAHLMETVWATLEKALDIVNVAEAALITGRRIIVATTTMERQKTATQPFQPQPIHTN